MKTNKIKLLDRGITAVGVSVVLGVFGGMALYVNYLLAQGVEIHGLIVSNQFAGFLVGLSIAGSCWFYSLRFGLIHKILEDERTVREHFVSQKVVDEHLHELAESLHKAYDAVTRLQGKLARFVGSNEDEKKIKIQLLKAEESAVLVNKKFWRPRDRYGALGFIVRTRYKDYLPDSTWKEATAT